MKRGWIACLGIIFLVHVGYGQNISGDTWQNISGDTWQNISGDTWQKVKASGSGEIVVSYVETPAFVYTDDAGKLTGISVDILKYFVNYVEKSEKVSLSIRYLPASTTFSDMLSNVENGSGGVFGLANITITDARQEIMDFSPSIITNIAVLVSQNNRAELSSVEMISREFADMKAYISSGTTHETRMRDLKNRYFRALEIKKFDSSQLALEAMLTDGNVFSYQDVALYWDALQKGKPIMRHPVGDQATEKFGIAMTKNSDWTPLMDKFFTLGSGFRSSLPYRQILVNHLGAEVLQMLKLTAE